MYRSSTAMFVVSDNSSARATFVIQVNLYQLLISPCAHGASKVLSCFIKLLQQRKSFADQQIDHIPLVTEKLQLQNR
jgi:hypothetical protein